MGSNVSSIPTEEKQKIVDDLADRIVSLYCENPARFDIWIRPDFHLRADDLGFVFDTFNKKCNPRPYTVMYINGIRISFINNLSAKHVVITATPFSERCA